MSAFFDPSEFAFTRVLEERFARLRDEVGAVDPTRFEPAPDSLTTVSGRYDERGWLWLGLFGVGRALEENRALCPQLASACRAVPDLVNAGVSLFRPGTHLYPHAGEMRGVLRCHLPLIVPPGDVALRIGGERRAWSEGRCLVFDDRFEHEAWNHAASARVVLIVTFRSARAGA